MEIPPYLTNPLTFALLFAVGIVVYPVALGIYRIYFSPLRHIPGPKLSIATGWVEVWYDVIQGGQFMFAVEKWHQQYGQWGLNEASGKLLTDW